MEARNQTVQTICGIGCMSFVLVVLFWMMYGKKDKDIDRHRIDFKEAARLDYQEVVSRYGTFIPASGHFFTGVTLYKEVVDPKEGRKTYEPFATVICEQEVDENGVTRKMIKLHDKANEKVIWVNTLTELILYGTIYFVEASDPAILARSIERC